MFTLCTGKELRYYTSREGDSECRADGLSPYRGQMKKFYCNDKDAGVLCENDKFCTTPGQKCLCNPQCLPKRCKDPGKCLFVCFLLVCFFVRLFVCSFVFD